MLADVLLLLVGVAIGIAVKAYVEPVIRARVGAAERRERWLEDAMGHAEGVLSHIQVERSAVTAPLGFDLEAIDRAIIRTLTPEYGPTPIRDAVNNPKADDELKDFASQAADAWISVGFARMDAEHGVEAAHPEHEPTYALQRYSVALGNFAAAARARLSR